MVQAHRKTDFPFSLSGQQILTPFNVPFSFDLETEVESGRQQAQEAERLRGVVDLLQRKYNELMAHLASRDEAVADLQHMVDSLESQLVDSNQLTEELANVKEQLAATEEELQQIDELISRYSRDETQQRTAFGGVQELIEACIKMQAKVTNSEKTISEVQGELESQARLTQQAERLVQETEVRLTSELEETRKEAEALQVRFLELEVETDSRVSTMQDEHHGEARKLKEQIQTLQELAEKEIRQRPPTDSEGFYFFSLPDPADPRETQFYYSPFSLLSAQSMIKSLRLEIEILKKTVMKKDVELESTQFALDDGAHQFSTQTTQPTTKTHLNQQPTIAISRLNAGPMTGGFNNDKELREKQAELEAVRIKLAELQQASGRINELEHRVAHHEQV